MRRFTPSPLVIRLAGAAAFALVLWFGLPLVPGIRGTDWVSVDVRATLIGCWLGGWLLFHAARRWRRGRANRQLVRYLIDASDQVAGKQGWILPGWWRHRHHALDDGTGIRRRSAEVSYTGTSAAFGSNEQLQASLQDQFVGTLWALRRFKDDRGGTQSIGQVPWFLVVGARGAGKSSFLERGGLPYPIAQIQAQNPVAGCGPTRDCNWWFHQDAVLIETAGRYFSRDSVAGDDQGDWHRFLEFLTPPRNRPPIRGLLLLVDLRKVIDPRHRPGEVALVRQRLDEIRDRLGQGCRTYLVLTHLDQILGFSESFEQASPEYRHNRWGLLAPAPDPTDDQRDRPASRWVSDGWTELARRVSRTLTVRLQAEEQLAIRLAAVSFPNQLVSARHSVVEFVRVLFDDCGLSSSLHGLFLCSANQTPARWDWVSPLIRHQFGLDGNLPRMGPDLPRGFFVQGAIHQVAIAQNRLASAPGSQTTGRRWQAVVRSVLVVLSLALLMSWSYNTVQNRRLIDRLDGQIAQLKPALQAQRERPATPIELVAVLNGLAASTEVFPAYAPMALRTGLYQGPEVRETAVRAYKRALRTLFMASLTRRLEQSLHSSAPGSRQAIDAVAVYSTLDDPQRLDRQGIRRWFTRLWKNNSDLDPATRKALQTHLDKLLELRIEPQVIDYALITASHS